VESEERQYSTKTRGRRAVSGVRLLLFQYSAGKNDTQSITLISRRRIKSKSN
jgi:hypothetical protein